MPFVALCRLDSVRWNEQCHDNPPPRIYLSLPRKDNRNGRNRGNGYERVRTAPQRTPWQTEINLRRTYLRAASETRFHDTVERSFSADPHKSWEARGLLQRLAGGRSDSTDPLRSENNLSAHNWPEITLARGEAVDAVRGVARNQGDFFLPRRQAWRCLSPLAGNLSNRPATYVIDLTRSITTPLCCVGFARLCFVLVLLASFKIAGFWATLILREGIYYFGMVVVGYWVWDIV